ncbi:hypothetical protein RchiOBHm_Chr2g0165391 [Rosa chinensis]|uniref:Uncharacterized protein n=1 Tax=Rosa chinensis TaxID=74649 RepID=A0A2P6S3T7_ROSCH|nr:hypothetical protein RchiOBHm_Chr2g0165391 [Rosa chinensis]
MSFVSRSASSAITGDSGHRMSCKCCLGVFNSFTRVIVVLGLGSMAG